jgi:hypothetical protein
MAPGLFSSIRLKVFNPADEQGLDNDGSSDQRGSHA